MTDQLNEIPEAARPTLVFTMNTLDFVRWDRLIVSAAGEVNAYGWIDRDDGRSDFALIRVNTEGLGMVFTSSAEHDPLIGQLVNPGDVGGPNNPCQRVEDVLPEVESSVRLGA